MSINVCICLPFVSLIFCKGQECYLEIPLLYFILIHSSISVHLFIFCLFNLDIQVDMCCLVDILESFFNVISVWQRL